MNEPGGRWAAGVFAVLGLGLLPWALWLGYSLPSRQVAHHWDLAWAGFDVLLSLTLLATAYALVTGSSVGRSLAAATGALLVADAWFDVVTAADAHERTLALVFALCAEIPLAILCFVITRPRLVRPDQQG